MFIQVRYQFILQALEPIAHHAESDGNQAIFFRKKVVQPDGSIRLVPYVTADTMRHGLREAGTLAYLDAAGLLDVASLTESALRLLFSGGMITGKGQDSGSVSLDAYRELVELVPHLGLLGGCARNRSIPGKVQVSDAVLVCEESRHKLAPWQQEAIGSRQIAGHRAYLENETRVRMDPLLDPGKRLLLTDGDQVKAAGRLVASESASESGDAIAKDDAKSTMMPRAYERVCDGALFSWTVDATIQSPLERDAFDVMIASFLARGKVGGKKGTGNGAIGVFAGAEGYAAKVIPILRPAEQTQSLVLGQGIGQMFRAHVAANKARIADLLAKIDA
jgi:hypothetical protein